MSVQSERIVSRLRRLGDREIAEHSQRFFKTGKGEYGEGDRFLGIRVPALRKLTREYRETPLEDTLDLLQSPFHEARMLALLMLVSRYTRGASAERGTVYRSYLGHTEHINGWDLVDCTAEHIVGAHLFARNRRPLYRLARSKDLWERRIGIVSTFHFIRREDFRDTLAIAELLLGDREDLIHKAAGWMLREVGKRDLEAERKFLTKHCGSMPRTMLRYAIERLPDAERRGYLQIGVKPKK